jgi:hypothetical protein
MIAQYRSIGQSWGQFGDVNHFIYFIPFYGASTVINGKMRFF